MGSDRRMSRIQLLLPACLVVSSLVSLAAGSPLEVMAAPNLLRVGTPENIFVEIHDNDLTDPVNVEIAVLSHPTRSDTLAFKTVTLNTGNKFQDFGKITIPADKFSKNPNNKQFVYLQARFPQRELEKVVLVSFHSGHIFIQTDKPIYTPKSDVKYRIFAVRPGMEPVEKAAHTDTSVIVEIVNPDGIVVESSMFSMDPGIHSKIYPLPEIVSIGLWKVVAKFHADPQQSFAAEFEVKEYVLPSFEVKLKPDSVFFYVNSSELTINIKATYLFGEEVRGTAYVLFGVMNGTRKQSFPSSLQRVKIDRGNGEAKLKREHITQTNLNIMSLVGSSIFVSVSVLTESGSEMVEAELNDIQIVVSPYTINFKKTRKYFQPGASLDVMIEVLNPDGSPARGVPVEVEPGEAGGGSTGANGLARLTINTEGISRPLTITARTNDKRLPPERQTNTTMVAFPSTSRSNNYIVIGVDLAEVALGHNMKITFNLNRQERDHQITYLIMSRGQLVKHRQCSNKRQIVITQMLLISKEMLPSFRIIAYYNPSPDEVVSDSVWVDVTDSCMGSLQLEVLTPNPPYFPRNMIDLKITGDPGATVGLVAVDKGVYVLNNKHRLTQKKIWDTVEMYDTGCTAGGGQDSLSVFYDAGLMFQTSTASGTRYRTDLKCPTLSRRKRDTTIMEVTTSLVSQYKDALERDCCLDGMKDSPVSYSCERRSQYVIDGQACAKAFLNCCKEMESQRADRKVESLQLARSDKFDGYKMSHEIVSRFQFPESWLWHDIKLDDCDTCDTMSLSRKDPLPDSITTWELTAISLSRSHGICVANPLEVVVRKKFFIDLRLPYSAVRGEQLEIKAILHNYNTFDVTVRIDLKEDSSVCSAAYKRGWFRQEVSVGSETTRSVSYVIVPLKHGQLPIEVKAVVKEWGMSDGVRKRLLVVPEGVLVKDLKTLKIEPAKQGGKQEEIINSRILRTAMVPNTPMRTILSLTGREQMSELLENAISGNSMGTLIQQPGGCGEQNMIGMTLPVIATTYLDKTNQWEDVGFDKRDEALKHIKTGYDTQLSFRKSDGSFAVYSHMESSTWLTAYVAKVFAMANSLVLVDSDVICSAIKFLNLKTQQPDGLFTEIGFVFSRAMIGDVFGTDTDASLTAFCLIALQESRTICETSVDSLTNSIRKSVDYLENRLPFLSNPYSVAITSYALANENKLNLGILYKFASPDRSHWPVPNEYLYTLEATAYALLTLVKAKAFEDAKPVVRWLSEQQKVDGGYGSTQATIMVYQAVAEYWTNAKEPDYDLNVDILLPDRKLADKFNFNKKSQYSTRSSKFNGINKDIKVSATGTGEAVFKMVSLYYTLPEAKESDCEMFNMTVELLPDDDQTIYKLKIEVLFNNTQRNSTMAILDIGLPTGCTFVKEDLESLSKGRAPIISKYEMNRVLSEKGSLIIYLNKISNVQKEEVSFRIRQDMPVGFLQPAAVTVYEYNEEKRCVKYYHPKRIQGQLMRLCRGDECTCAEENCSMQKKEKIENAARTLKLCEVTETSRIDYVYKVKVENIKDGLSTDIYTMQIVDVIKEGTTDVGPQGNRTFLSYKHCSGALDLKTGKTYLIMGSSKDIQTDDQNRLYEYVLGEKTWVEYWPSDAECLTTDHSTTCMGMQELVATYRHFGCQL